jgi:addiction module RelE/StbE family toxin
VIKITWDQGFKRIYRKKIKNDDELKNRFWKTLEAFSKNPFNRQLRAHKLTGKLEGLWAFSVTYDCRVIFKYLSHNEVLLIDIGGHEEVY